MDKFLLALLIQHKDKTPELVICYEEENRDLLSLLAPNNDVVDY